MATLSTRAGWKKDRLSREFGVSQLTISASLFTERLNQLMAQLIKAQLIFFVHLSYFCYTYTYHCLKQE